MSSYKMQVVVSYQNAVVPNFDSYGKPDLLQWDEDMRDSSPERDVLAVFYNEDMFKALKPSIDAWIPSEDVLRDMYHSDYVDVELERVSTKARLSFDNGGFPDVTDPDRDDLLKWFWSEVACVSNGFDPSDYGWSDTDIEDKEYDWENDGFWKQMPKYSDFLKIVEKELIYGFQRCVRPTDISPQEEYEWTTNYNDNLLECAKAFYGYDTWADYAGKAA